MLANTLVQLICYWDLSTFQPPMCKHFVSAIYVIGKVLNTFLMQILLSLGQNIFLKSHKAYCINVIFFLPIAYLIVFFKYTLLLYVSGAEIAFIYQRCEWHNGFLCTLPVKSITTANWANFCFSTCFLVFCQLSVFHGSFSKHYSEWLFWVAICQSHLFSLLFSKQKK